MDSMMSMSESDIDCMKSKVMKGAWTPEEDRKLAEVIEVHGAKRWKSIAVKAGLNRTGKSCRLRWLNYLRPNIKRGGISDQEEDLILRLHKLLGNRWSLIAGRLPGRTDNEIKNYWNSHLSKKMKQRDEKQSSGNSAREEKQRVEVVEEEIMMIPEEANLSMREENSTEEASHHINQIHKDLSSSSSSSQLSKPLSFDDHGFFHFSEEECPLTLEWVSHFLELDEATLQVFSL